LLKETRQKIEEWDRLEKVMKEILQENVGPRRSKVNKDWFTEKGFTRTVPGKINTTKQTDRRK
jgi:hypothetical protein